MQRHSIGSSWMSNGVLFGATEKTFSLVREKFLSVGVVNWLQLQVRVLLCVLKQVMCVKEKKKRKSEPQMA